MAIIAILFFLSNFMKWRGKLDEFAAAGSSIGPHTPTPGLCGIPSGLQDLGACAPAQWPPQTHPWPLRDPLRAGDLGACAPAQWPPKTTPAHSGICLRQFGIALRAGILPYRFTEILERPVGTIVSIVRWNIDQRTFSALSVEQLACSTLPRFDHGSHKPRHVGLLDGQAS